MKPKSESILEIMKALDGGLDDLMGLESMELDGEIKKAYTNKILERILKILQLQNGDSLDENKLFYIKNLVISPYSDSTISSLNNHIELLGQFIQPNIIDKLKFSEDELKKIKEKIEKLKQHSDFQEHQMLDIDGIPRL